MLFDSAGRLVSEPKGIALETRTRRPIANEIPVEAPAEHLRKLANLTTLYGTAWKERKPFTSGYNCAGHVWASRRTSIFEEAALRLIIEEDGYRPFNTASSAVPGDIVMYWNETTGGQRSWLHTGVVWNLQPGLITVSDRPQGQGANPIPWVLSKWDSWSGEWFHRYDDVPFPRDGLVIEFLTERP
jgi:hypothetical protein